MRGVKEDGSLRESVLPPRLHIHLARIQSDMGTFRIEVRVANGLPEADDPRETKLWGRDLPGHALQEDRLPEVLLGLRGRAVGGWEENLGASDAKLRHMPHVSI